MRRSYSSRWLQLTGAVALAFAAACSGGLAQTPSHPTQSTVVGTSGGTAPSTDGSMKLAVPSGALPKDVTITVTVASAPPGGALGTVYEIGPTGTTFASPVTMTFSYANLTFLGDQAASVRVATYVGGSWQPLTGYAWQASAQIVSGTTSSLATYYALWFPSTSGSSPMCIDFSGGTECSGSSSSNGGSSSTCTATTCSEALDLCVGYPGSTLKCTDSTSGYEASCCFPLGQVCVAASGSADCSGSSGSSSGTGSGSGGSITCGATPTCADSLPCGALPGTTLKSCADSTSGYSATCCYAPGVLPPSDASGGSSSGAGSGSGSSSGAGGGSGSSSGTGGGSSNGGG